MECEDEDEEYAREMTRREENIIKSFLYDPVSNMKVGNQSNVEAYIEKQSTNRQTLKKGLEESSSSHDIEIEDLSGLLESDK